jgi:hypothetical protein
MYVAQLEQLWQTLPARRRSKGDVRETTARLVTRYLRQSFLSWRQAKRLARSGSLSPRLRFIRQKIEEYRNKWEMLQTPPPVDPTAPQHDRPSSNPKGQP